jgi:hypothetical protein
MLAEAFMLRLETDRRGTAQTTQASSAKLVPFTGGVVFAADKRKAAGK